MDDIIYPDNPRAGEEIDIIVKITVDSEGDWENNLVFAMLAPVSWNVAKNAELILNSTDGVFTVNNMQMELIPADELCPNSGGTSYPAGSTWSEAFTYIYGYAANYIEGGMEWVVWKTPQIFEMKGGELAKGDMLIRVKTPEENVRAVLAFAIGGLQKGLDDRAYMDKRIEVTGAEGDLIDHTYKEGVMNGSIGKISYNPFEPVAGELVDINATVMISGKDAASSPLTVGVLVPRSWDLANNATVSLTTADYSGGDISDEIMTPVPENDPEDEDDKKGLEPVSGLPWSRAFMNKFGYMGNYAGYEYEWVVFSSSTVFEIDGESNDVTCDIKISFTPEDALKVILGFAMCGEVYGFDESGYSSLAGSKVFIADGDREQLIDYRKDPSREYPEPIMFINVPEIFRFGDIFGIRFDAEGEFYEHLNDANKVFMYVKAVMSDGSETVVSRTEMKNIESKIWQKFIYPPYFFEMGDVSGIERLEVHFMNEDNSITVRNGAIDFIVTQSAD